MGKYGTWGDFIIGVEGLAILRAWGIDPEGVRARADEIASLLAKSNDPTLRTPVVRREDSVTSGYTEWANTYDIPDNPVIMAEERVMHRLLDSYPVGDALDAACGTGRHAAYLARRGHRVTGIDATEEMLEKARKKVPKASFQIGNLESLPLGDVSMDLAVCSLALTHLPKVDRAIKEMARVVRPGGRVVVSDVHPFMVATGGQAAYPKRDGTMGFVRNYLHLHSAYLDAFREAGLKVTECLEPLWGEAELKTQAWAKDVPDLPRAALTGLAVVLVWETVKP